MFEGIVLVVDDQLLAVETSIAALKQYVPEEQILYALDGDSAVQMMKTRNISLVFLDIEMPDTSGFALASYIEENHSETAYVFLTGHADFALEGYEYSPADFLTKPIDIKRLGKTFEKIAKKKLLFDNEKLAVRTRQGYTLVSPQEILYICKEKRKVWIRLKNGGEYQVDATMEELERIFNDYGFFRCHQSILIPTGSVQIVGNSKFGQTYEAILDDGTVVPVSRGKYKSLKEELEKAGILFVKGVLQKE